MTNILLSAAVRHNVLQLQGIDRLLKATETRITSGKRVGTPSDNPAAFFTASSLSQRAGDLNQLLDDFGNKLQTLKAADAAVNSIIALVQSGEADLNSALASTAPRPTATGNIIVSDQSDVTNLAGVADGDQFDIQVGAAGAVTITVDAGDSATTLLNEINAVANVEASYTTEGFLQISSTNNEDLILSETTNTPLAGLGITPATYDATSSPSSFRTTKASDFDELRTQINELASDAFYSGVNLLLGDDLKINFNETGTSSLTISGVTFTSSGLNIDAAQNNFQLDTDITAAKADLERALDTLRDFSSTLSTNIAISEVRENFNTEFSNLLQAGADQLTLANVNEESANLLALQTRNDLAITTLSILQKSERSVLSLF